MRAPRKPLSSFEFDSVLRFIQEVIDGEQHRKQLLETQGGIAQEWLDLFQLLVEYPNIARDLRSWIFKLMIRLSRKSGLHPQCLTIRDVEKLGDYPVAGGAFGDVWKGRIGQQLVCLKMIRAFDISDLRQILKDYMQEAIIWRQLNHRNLLPFIGVYYLDTEQRQLCLVSPWMEQGNLVQFLKNTSSDLVDHDVLAYDVACGLSYLHAENIVHGDLKGVNILITPDLRACIADFGLSRVSATQLLLSETSRSKGTVRWLSPELLRPGPSCNSSKESDVYAYACVCYEIFTGRSPLYELNETAIIWAVLMEKRHPSRPENCSKLRDSMWDMMVACWNEVPSSRPTITDILPRIHETNGDHRLEPASEWNDPTFTQIWNDAEHSPVFHAAESILPRSEHYKNELFVPMPKLPAPFSGGAPPISSEWNDPTFKQIGINAAHSPVFHAAESILPRSEHFKNGLFVPMPKLPAPFSGPPISLPMLGRPPPPSVMPSRVSYPYQNTGLESTAILPMVDIHPQSLPFGQIQSQLTGGASGSGATPVGGLPNQFKGLKTKQPHKPPVKSSVKLPLALTHTNRAGCWTCRIRRKKCDEERLENNSCRTCQRLEIECLGWSARRPEWMRNKQAVDEYRASVKDQLARRGQPRGTTDTIPTPPSPNSIQESHVLYYFENFPRTHCIMSNRHDIMNITFELIVQEPRGALTNAVCALANLHYTQFRVAQGVEAPNPNPEHSTAKYFYDEAYFQLINAKQLRRSYTEADAFAALHLVCYSQLSGGSTDWQPVLHIALDWIEQLGLPKEHNPATTLGMMSFSTQLSVKCTMMIDIISSITFMHPPKYFELYRHLLSWTGGMQMDILSGCSDEAWLAIAEVSGLPFWRAAEESKGSLSFLDFLRRADAIKGRLRANINTTRSQDTVPSHPKTSPSEEVRPVIANIFQEAALLYLHTVTHNMPDIRSSVEKIVRMIQQLAPSEIDCGLVFPICLAGCMTDDWIHRNRLKGMLQEHEETIGNFMKIRLLMEGVWKRRDLPRGWGWNADWREQMRAMNLLLI